MSQATIANARVLTEDVISLSQAAKELPQRPHAATVWRWSRHGVGGVKLETVKIGGFAFTSRQALTRFLAAIQN